MKTRRGWILLSVLIVIVIIVLVISLYPRGYLPYNPITQDGESPPTQGVETPPTAPSSLGGQAISYSEITIQWIDNSDNEDGFRIYRNGALVESVGLDTARFQDSNLEYATVYNYHVTAYNEYGETQCPIDINIRTLNPPITVTLDKIGVIFDHDPFVKGAGELYLYIAITDGTSEPQVIRVPYSETINLNDNESREVRQQLFVADSVGDELRIVVIAFESDDSAVDAMVNFLGQTLASYLLGDWSGAVILLVDLLQSQSSVDEEAYQEIAESAADDFVGAVEQTWTAAQSWGIGSHADVRSGDLRLWFTISMP